MNEKEFHPEIIGETKEMAGSVTGDPFAENISTPLS